MQDAKVYMELLHERGTKGLPLERVYRQLFNPMLYLAAYGKIYRNAGAMTPGVTPETVDGMSLDKIGMIIDALRREQYRWRPARRTYIPKKNGKTRPLGLPTWSDKVLGEVIRSILEAYYDPRFSAHSHGFRPGRGCHTALREIYYTWPGTTWFIEGDISACFDSLDHDLILATLQEDIHDGRFMELMRGLLAAGYLEEWHWHHTLSGVPQGSVVSPLLSNILLNKLDTFVETTLIPRYTRGERRRNNLTYTRLMKHASSLFHQGRRDEAHLLRRRAQHMPSVDPNDPHFRRLRYCRYADDFLLGFIGPRSEAEEIKQEIGVFLHETLKLELSHTKTLITHARSEAARFLGYEITTLQSDTKQVRVTACGTTRRSINGRVGLRVPRTVIQEKCARYTKGGRPGHRFELLAESDYTIMMTYQLEYRGIVNYYRMAYNLHTLDRLKQVMEHSLTQTLAHKHRMSVAKVYDAYRANLEVDGATYRGLRVTVPREGQPPLVATWGGIALTWDVLADLEDHPPRLWGRRSEIERRLLAQVCEHCGATRDTDKIEVHHIRALQDVTKYPGRIKPEWATIMAARRRKTLVLCRTCHLDLHHGRPLRRRQHPPPS
jgi:group II intron reverse transcriptase/maturase